MSDIPRSVIDTDWVRARERFSFWHAALAASHNVALPDGCDPAAFSAWASNWNLGTMLVLESRATPQRLNRTNRQIRKDQIDHYLIRLQRGGQWTGTIGENVVTAEPGTVMILDMARTSQAQTTNIDNINLLVPRDVLDAVVPPFDMHGLVLQGPLQALLRDHLQSLAGNLPMMRAADSSSVADATVALLAACIAPSGENAERASAPLDAARFDSVRRYIDAHLESPDLSPERICAALRISRSTLYALCEKAGGVMALIQRRRLRRIHRELMNPRDFRSIAAIAGSYGFSNAAHFSRAFRSAFGCSPREARQFSVALARAGENDRANPSVGQYAHWLHRIGA